MMRFSKVAIYKTITQNQLFFYVLIMNNSKENQEHDPIKDSMRKNILLRNKLNSEDKSIL